MLLIKRENAPHAIMIFGMGLIGSAIARSLLGAGLTAREIPWSWGPTDTNNESSAYLIGCLKQWLAADDSNDDVFFTVDIVWSAGVGGFALSASEAESEYQAFRNVIRFVEELGIVGEQLVLKFSLISSAGGLFEGQQVISNDSTPAPLREYGWLKLREEDLLDRSTWIDERRIFRPSTVYGAPDKGVRQGLIATLLTNAWRGRVTQLSGTLDTLRDYVWVSDMARFIAQILLDEPTNNSNKQSVWYLISGRPVSLQYIVILVERLLRRRPLKAFAPATNALDMTFSPTLENRMPQVTPIEQGVATVFRQMFNVHTLNVGGRLGF